MYPKLFEIGPVPVYSYGLMLGIAFLVGSHLLNRELIRKKINPDFGVNITFISLIGGIIGAKLFYTLEEWNFRGLDILSSQLKPDVLFSAAGLTFYGGLLTAIAGLIIFCRFKKIKVLDLFDSIAPIAALCYGIARIGCHLSGDGDYGIEVNGTFWEFIGYSYANGTVPTDPGVLVHPTPIYEFIASIIIFIYLWNRRAKIKFTGQLFYTYLILAGIERFLIEMIRLNPKVIFDLSQAQLISIAFIVSGFIALYVNKSKKNYQTQQNQN